MKKIFKKIIFIIFIIIICLGIFIFNFFNSFRFNNNDSFIKPIEVKNNESYNILLLGVDIGVVGSKNSPKRTDTMMVIHYDKIGDKISIISIPRDTKVIINNKNEKINAANVYGGTQLAINTVQELLNIDINYYIEIDYEGFKKIIDSIGGIDVTIPFNMNYDDDMQNLHIHFTKDEKVHLDGQKAEEFVRWRKNNDGTGYAEADIGRIKTQQDFILKVFEKIKTPAILIKMPSIIKMLPQYIKTNMEPLTIAKFVLLEFPKLNKACIQNYTLQGESKTISSISYFIYEPSKNSDIMDILLNKNTVSQKNDIDVKNIKIEIFNSTEINGAATKLKNELISKGYNVINIGTITGSNLDSTYIIDKTNKAGYAKQVASEININNIKNINDNISLADIIIILGNDIINKK